jgi:predicted MPP superfamily phosphohydrolase
MIMLAYTIPNIYVFFRIWQLFISKGFRLKYTLIYLAVIAIYPASDMLNNGNLAFLGEILGIISNYLLPFYLYLFLAILVFDIFLLINLFVRVLPSEKRKSFTFRKYCLSSIIIVAALVVIGGVINFSTIRTTEYSIEVPARSSELEHLRLAFAADFHIDTDTPVNFVKRFVEKVESVSPDIMLFGGDIVEGHDGEKMDRHEELLNEISPRYGVYGVLGNHEYYRGQDRGSFFDKAGIEILRDTIIVMDNGFSLAGRLDSHYRNRKSVEELLVSAADSLPVILLDHRPTELIEASNTRADVQLSGHTHDGQMFPINLITRKVYLLSKGYLKIANTHFFVTSGIRQWRFPVRTTGKSEIMVIDINFVR